MDQGIRDAINYFADAVRKYYSIKSPITDINSIVQKIGGRVEETDQIETYSDGYIKKENESFVIYIPKEQPESRRNFTIAHELGHLFLHMGFKSDPQKWADQDNKTYHRGSSSLAELQANEFAAAFLMPKEKYKSIIVEFSNGNIVETSSIANYFHVSVEAASTRGKWLGYLQWQ